MDDREQLAEGIASFESEDGRPNFSLPGSYS